MEFNYYLRRNEECAYQVIEGEAIIVKLLPDGDSRVLSLNQAGTFVWQLADGSLTVDQISGLVAREYGAGAEEIASDIADFAKDLTGRGLAFLQREQEKVGHAA